MIKTLSKEAFEKFARVIFSTYNVEQFKIDEVAALRSLAKGLGENFEELNADKTKEARKEFFHIPDAKAEDYMEHCLEISEGKHVICGIRHKAGNKDKPFVEIVSDFETSQVELLNIYHDRFAKLFEVFKPLSLRYFSKQKVAQSEIGQCYMVQSANGIRQEKFNGEDEIELIAPKNEDYYAWYEEAYKSFHLQYPDYKDSVTVNSLSLMEKSREAGLLKIARRGKENIGLIAALPDDFLGQKGIYFVEILILDKWRKKRLGKALQRKFISENCKGNDIVWGTIDASNLASLKTAQATGRVTVRYENFVAL